MDKIVSKLSFMDVLELINISKQTKENTLIAANGQPLYEYLENFLEQSNIDQVVAVIGEINNKHMEVEIYEKELYDIVRREVPDEYSSDTFLSLILYYLLNVTEYDKYIITGATSEIYNNIISEAGDKISLYSDSPLQELKDLWSDEQELWYIFLDATDKNELKIFASSREGEDSVCVRPSTFIEFIKNYDIAENFWKDLPDSNDEPVFITTQPVVHDFVEDIKHEMITQELNKKAAAIEAKQKKLIHSHPTHRVWYKKIQLWGDLSIRYHYHFQDHPELENTWILKIHDDKSKNKFTKISREYADQLIKNYEKHARQKPEIEHIVGMSIMDGEYDKFFLVSDQHLHEVN